MPMPSAFKIVLTFFAVLACLATASAQSGKTDFKFDFGSGKAGKDYLKVTPSTTFNDTIGYGFDFGSKVSVVVRNSKKELTGEYITADKPFYFSVNVPEGNYMVTVTLGDIKGKSMTTVRAESRRLMLEGVKTENGETKKLSFIVNIRKPAISTGGTVRLSPRELGKLDWD